MGAAMTFRRFRNGGRATSGRNGSCRLLKDQRWQAIPATGFCSTPSSRALLMLSVAMIYPLLIAIAEGSSRPPNP